MGSSYFYLEYLMTWLSVLSASGYSNPAIFAIEYSLVPEASFPTQVDETVKGYEHVLKVARDPSIVCVSGDSAGATLILCLLLRLGDKRANGPAGGEHGIPKPVLAVLISPWVTLVSPRHRNSASDYLDAARVHEYGRQYAGSRRSCTDPSVSPGCCKDISWWKRSSPSRGIFVSYGTEELLRPETEVFIDMLREANVIVGTWAEPRGIHVWPVASLFLSDDRDDRLGGIMTITREIRQRVR